jgi:hypothetical protein
MCLGLDLALSPAMQTYKTQVPDLYCHFIGN